MISGRLCSAYGKFIDSASRRKVQRSFDNACHRGILASMAEVENQKSAIGNAELAQRFVQFVMMQVQNIFYVLGRIPSPDGRPIPPNLEAAKLLIHQLRMIQEKKRGNLSAQESA